MEVGVDLIAKDLSQRAQAMAAGSTMDVRENIHPEIDAVVRRLLQSGSQLIFSCAALAQGPHSLAINILLRSIIELGIKVHWATLSSGNSRLLGAASKEQLKAIFMVNNQRGVLKIVDESGVDHTASFLAQGAAERGAKIPSIETMARQSGLIDIYNVFYRFQSLHAHINDVGDESTHPVASTLGAIGAFSVLLGHLGISWLVHRTRPTNEEIRTIMGLGSRVRP